MSYVPRTVLAGGLTGLPSGLAYIPPSDFRVPRQRRAYKKFERSPTAQKIMRCIVANPGILAGKVDGLVGLANSYAYLPSLRADGYLEVTTERNHRNVPIMRVWPSKIYLAKFPRVL